MENQLIEDLIQKFKPVISDDYDRYRNHIYRVYLNCLLIDDRKTNHEKYAIASVFHDIGIWTDNTFDYLEPSIKRAAIYLNSINKKNLTDEITLMICWHHKINNYKGKYQETVETFRKADMMDVTFRLINFGCDKKTLKENFELFPGLGFHLFLVKKTINNFFKQPLNPLPMIKK